MKLIFAYTPRSLSSFLIKLLTFSKWSHVGTAISDSLVLDATFIDGVKLSTYDDFINKYPHNEIVDITVKNEQASINFAIDQVGKPYDWTALLAMPLRGKWNNSDAWFCSELAEAVLLAGGLKRFRDEIHRITPQQSWANLQGCT